ncbi:MAG TPA: FAD-dependent monooxygenase [Candidatus Eisenbacteria bacterium]|nr:FAD-dependent monooxygenase [Candidatus Eisenbacteria bacterium]
MRVLIVGAGIGGLTLAHALRQRGLSFDLVERAERWEPVGAGLGLWSNALRVLDRLGLFERVVAAGIPFTGGEVTDERGRVLTSVHYPSSGSRIPVGVALLHYDLHEALRHGLEDSTRMATTYPRVRGDYDLVVGADGIGSQVRERFWGTVPIRDAGYTSWRFVVPLAIPLPGATEMWGRGKRVGLVPLRGGRLYCFATRNVPAEFEDPVKGRLARFREHFGDFGGHFPAALTALTRDEELIHARLGDVRLTSWTRPGAALLGDAAHAMTPNVAQGAAMAIEDAWVLAECVARNELSAYEPARRKRVEWVQKLSWRFGVVGQWQSPLACFVRDRAMRLAPTDAAPRRLASILDGGPC